MPAGIDDLRSVAVNLVVSKVEERAIGDGRVVSGVTFGHKLEIPHPDD
jgi:hypothetical protein